MADPELDDQAIGDEAVRRGLLTKDSLAEARQTQRLAIEAGLPITLAEVLAQRKYLTPIQIEALQGRLREQAQARTAQPRIEPAGEAARDRRNEPAPQALRGPTPPLPPPSPDERHTPSALPPTARAHVRGDSTRSLPVRPSTRGSSTERKVPVKPPSGELAAMGPFPPIPSPTDAPPAPAVRPPSARVPMGGSPAVPYPAIPPASAKPAPTEKRASARAAAVPSSKSKRASSISKEALSPEGSSRESGRQAKRASGLTAATPPAPAKRTSSVNVPVVSSASSAGKTPVVESHPPATAAAAEQPRRKTRAFPWVLVVLLLLAGAGVGAWLMLRSPNSGVLPKANSYGPSFAPLAYWLVVGPFPAKDGADLDQVHAPENRARDLNATMKGAKGPLKWKLARMQSDLISFDGELGEHINCNGYGLTYIECPVETQATLGIGSDDAVRVYLNGEKVHENRTQRGCTVDADHVKVTLKRGVNELLIKIGQGTGNWGFAVTIRALDGKPLTGLKGRLPKEIAIPELAAKPAPK